MFLKILKCYISSSFTLQKPKVKLFNLNEAYLERSLSVMLSSLGYYLNLLHNGNKQTNKKDQRSMKQQQHYRLKPIIVQSLVMFSRVDLKNIVPILNDSTFSNGYSLEYTSCFTQCGWINIFLHHPFIMSFHHPSFVIILKNIDHCKSANATSLSRPTKPDILAVLITLYCTWE